MTNKEQNTMPDGFKLGEPQQTIQDWMIGNGYPLVASECDDLWLEIKNLQAEANKEALEAARYLRKHIGKDYLNNKSRLEIEKSHEMLNKVFKALGGSHD